MNTQTTSTAAIAISNFLAQPVNNADNEPVGKLQDILIDEAGTIQVAVVALGGVLGVGARSVAIPFGDCKIELGANGPQLRLPALRAGEVLVAPEYQPIGGTTFERMKEQAANLTQAAVTRAGELGQTMSDTAADLAKRASEASSEIADRISTPTPEETPPTREARDHKA